MNILQSNLATTNNKCPKKKQLTLSLFFCVLVRFCLSVNLLGKSQYTRQEVVPNGSCPADKLVFLDLPLTRSLIFFSGSRIYEKATMVGPKSFEISISRLLNFFFLFLYFIIPQCTKTDPCSKL